MGLDYSIKEKADTAPADGEHTAPGTERLQVDANNLRAQNPVRSLQTAEILAARLEDGGVELPTHISPRNLYLGNIGPAPDPVREVVIALDSDTGLKCSRGEHTKTASWNAPVWDSKARPSDMLFVPQIQGPEIGRNFHLDGREVMSGSRLEMSSSVIHHDLHGLCGVSPIHEDLSYYPPMQIQVPLIENAVVIPLDKSCSLARDLPCSVPYATFGAVVELEESDPDRRHRKTIDRVIVAYAGGALLAEREIAPDGVPGDCPAAHWSESLHVLRTLPSREVLEAGLRGHDVMKVQYSVHPKELAPLMGLNEDGTPVGGDPRLFYEKLEQILTRNSSNTRAF